MAALKAYTKMYLVPEGVYNRLFGSLGAEEKKNLFDLNEMSDQNITKNQKPPRPPPSDGGDFMDVDSSSVSRMDTDSIASVSKKDVSVPTPPSQPTPRGPTPASSLEDLYINPQASTSKQISDPDEPVASLQPPQDSEDEDEGNQFEEESVPEQHDSDNESNQMDLGDGEDRDKIERWTQTENEDEADVHQQLAECQEALAKAVAQLKNKTASGSRISSMGKIKKPQSTLTQLKKDKSKKNNPDCTDLRTSARLKQKGEQIRKWGDRDSESSGSSIDVNRVRKGSKKRKRRYDCDFCTKTYATIRGITNHYARTHDRIYTDNAKKIKVNE